MLWRFVSLLVLAGCAERPSATQPSRSAGSETKSGNAGASTSLAGSDHGEIVAAAMKADAVVVARLDEVDFSAPERDGFLTSMRFEVTDVVRGESRPHDLLRIRHVLGREPSGNWRWTADAPFLSPDVAGRMRIGEHFLLLTSRQTYEAQARALGGAALDGRTGAGLGLYRLHGTAIEPAGPHRLPTQVQSLKTLLKGH